MAVALAAVALVAFEAAASVAFETAAAAAAVGTLRRWAADNWNTGSGSTRNSAAECRAASAAVERPLPDTERQPRATAAGSVADNAVEVD